MSLDIGVRATREVEIFDRNITYNLSKMYYKCIPGGFKTLDGMRCKAALPISPESI